jgi:arylsulfatase A-like enzyme
MWPPKVLEGYQTDRLTDLSLEYLTTTAAGLDCPWFHVLSVEAPHHGRDDKGVDFVEVGGRRHTRHPAPPEYEAMFQAQDLQLRPNVPEDCDMAARSQQAQYYAQIRNLDHNVGRVMDWLDSSGLSDTTLVCFFSDHGEMGGSHDRFQKVCAYDESIRIPFMARLPGTIPAGTVVDAPFSLVDVFPTCASVCGVPVPEGVHGRDYREQLSGKGGADPREAALIQWFGNPRYRASGEAGPEYRAIRTRDFTYAVGEAAHDCLLFDNRSDPLQLRNLFGSADAAPVQRQLHTVLVREIVATGEPVPAFVASAAPA